MTDECLFVQLKHVEQISAMSNTEPEILFMALTSPHEYSFNEKNHALHFSQWLHWTFSCGGCISFLHHQGHMWWLHFYFTPPKPHVVVAFLFYTTKATCGGCISILHHQGHMWWLHLYFTPPHVVVAFLFYTTKGTCGGYHIIHLTDS